MKKAVKLFMGISFFLMACEDNGIITTQKNVSSNIKVKTLLAKLVKQVHPSPFILTSDSNSILGTQIFRDAEGKALYRVRVRPFYTFKIDFDSKFRLKDANGDLTDRLKFVRTHKFKFRVGSFRKGKFNSNFSQKIDLKLLRQPLSIKHAFSDKEGVWADSKYGVLSDQNADGVELLGTSSGLVSSSTKDTKSYYEIEIQNDKIKKLFKRFETDNKVSKYRFAGLSLDYTVEQEGMMSMDTLPYLELHYKEPDSEKIITETIKASIAYWYVSYEPLGEVLKNNYKTIHSGNRDAIIMEFNKNEMLSLLKNTRFYAAKFIFKHYDEGNNNPELFMYNLVSSKTIDDKRYNDGFPYDSIRTTGAAIKLSHNKRKNYYETVLTDLNIEKLYHEFFRNWINSSGEATRVYLKSSSRITPALATFKQITKPNIDSLYMLKIYYSEREN